MSDILDMTIMRKILSFLPVGRIIEQQPADQRGF